MKMTAWIVNCTNMMLLMSLTEDAAALPTLSEFLMFPSHCDFLVSSDNSVKFGNVVVVNG
jgi:hypothetical protein